MPKGYGMLAILVSILPPILFILWSGVSMNRRIDTHLTQLAPYVASELTTALKRKVHIGRIQLKPLTFYKLIQQALLPRSQQKVFIVNATDILLEATEAERKLQVSRNFATVESANITLTDANPVRVDVELIKPSLILVRNEKGNFPIADLFLANPRRVDDKETILDVRVTVAKASVRLRDYASPLASGLPRITELVDVEGALTVGGLYATRANFYGQARAATVNGPFVGRQIQVGLVIDHPIVGRDAATRITINGKNASLDYWIPYVKLDPKLTSITSGTADVNIEILALKQSTEVQGQVRVQNCNVDLPTTGLPRLKNTSASLRIYGGNVAFSGNAVVGDIPIDANGAIYVGGAASASEGTVRITAERTPTKRVAALLKTTLTFPKDVGLGDIKLEQAIVHWKGDAFDLEADASLAGLTHGQVKGDVSGNFHLVADAKNAQFTGTALAGSLTVPLSGSVDIKSGNTAISVQQNGIKLRQLQAVFRAFQSLRGLDTSLDVVGNISIKPRNKQPILATAHISGTVNETVHQTKALLVASVWADDRHVVITDARAIFADGMAKVAGKIDYTGVADLSGTFAGADMSIAGLIFGLDFDGGTASGAVTLEGNITEPLVQVTDLVLLNPRLRVEHRMLEADAIRCGGVRWSITEQSQLSIDLLQPLYVTWLPADTKITGRIRGSVESPIFDVNVYGRHIDITRVLPMIRGDMTPWASKGLHDFSAYRELSIAFGWEDPAWEVSGDVGTVSARISGTLDQVRIAGDIKVDSIALGDVRVGRVNSQFVWQNESLVLSQIQADIDAGRIKGQVTLSSQGVLDGVLQSDNINIALLATQANTRVPAAGILAMTARLSGSLNAPTVNAQVLVKQPIEYGALSWQPDAAITVVARRSESGSDVTGWDLMLNRVHAVAYGAEWTLSKAHWDGLSQLVSMDLNVKALDIPAVRSLLGGLSASGIPGLSVDVAERIPDNLNASLNISAHIESKFDGDAWVEPFVNITASAIKPSLAGVIFDQFSLEAELAAQVWDIKSARFESTDVVLEGRGTLGLPPAGSTAYAMDLTLESLSPSLEIVRAFVPDFPLRGKLDNVTVVAKGTTDHPQVQGTAEGVGIKWVSPNGNALSLELFRLNVQLESTPNGTTFLNVNEALAVHKGEEVRITASVPVSLDTVQILPNTTIKNLQFAVSNVSLATLSTLLQWNIADPLGKLNGNVTVSGTLNNPSLGGQLTASNVSGSVISPNPKRQVLSSIRTANLAVAMSGKLVKVVKGEIFLAPPPSMPKLSGGSATVSGSVTFDNLEDFTRLFRSTSVDQQAARLRGVFALDVKANALRPEVNNLTSILDVKDERGVVGLGEALSGQVDGILHITGDIFGPVFRSDKRSPLQIRDAIFRAPRPSAIAVSSKMSSLNPLWDLDFELASDAQAILFASTTVGLELRGRGTVHIGGSLLDPSVVANLVTTGGQLRYPLARLDVQRGGDLLVDWSKRKTTATLSSVVAEGRITGIADQTGARSVDSTFANPVLANTGASKSQTYKIRARISGVIDVGAVGGTDVLPLLNMDAEPNLSRNQIVDLLGARRQLDLMANGNTDQAVREFGSRIFESGLVPTVFAPITNTVRDRLRLDALDVTYGTDGLATFRAVRRFDAPFERFTADLSRSLSTRNIAGRQLPYSYGVNYELFTFRTRGKYQPRFLLGAAQTSQQTDTLFFIRGTVNY